MHGNLKSILLIISGPSCAGKTTIAGHISRALRIPVLGKDAIKESLFDLLGVGDREDSKRIGRMSMAVLYALADAQLRNGVSVLLESNFVPAFDREKIRALSETYGAAVTEIHCVADESVLFARFQERSASGERHPGHGDAGNEEEARRSFLSREIHGPISVGKTIVVDTTNGDAVNYDRLIKEIHESL